MKRSVRVGLLPVVLGLVTLSTAALSWAQNYSHARIVRLSFVEGTVTVQRPEVTDWAAAPVNTPIQEGFKLSTTENGFAEVEFENTSSVRIGQLSLLEFTQLALMPSGGKVNHLTLHQGYATFHLIPQGDDVYEVKAGAATLMPNGKTMFRVDLDAGLTRVEVFRGSVEVSGPAGSTTLTKDMVLNPGGEGEQPFQISRGITKDAWDEWVEQRENQVEIARSRPAPAYSSSYVDSPFYGWNDLSTYGLWSYIPGYGYGWAPNVSYGWAPYTVGRWSWYPSFGYTWISGEPWGWLPYHYGEWIYHPGFGWCWIPGSFGGWSPAQVNWYQGPGWVGWAPRSPQGTRGGGGQTNCSPAQRCTIAVPVDTVQNGRPVTPASVLDVDPAQGRAVARPDIAPGRLAMLPGAALPRPAAFYNSQDAEGAGRMGTREVTGSGPNVVVVGTAPAGRPVETRQGSTVSNRGAAAPDAGIVFDPLERRYVNTHSPRTGLETSESPSALGNSVPRVTPAGTVLPAERGESRMENSGGFSTRPSPEGNHAGRPPSGLFSGRTGFGERPSSSMTSSPSTAPDMGRGGGRSVGSPSGARGVAAPASRPSYSAPSSVRSAPASSSHSGGGSVSHSAHSSSSGSFGGGRSGGGSSSGATGGGHSSSSGGGGGSHSSGSSSSSGPRH